MKITRAINLNGQVCSTEYQLSADELEQAHFEYLRNTLAAEVRRQLEDNEDKHYIVDAIPEDLMNKIVSNAIDSIGGNSFDEHVIDAINNFKEELEQYNNKWKAYSIRLSATVTHEYTIRAEDEADAERIFNNWLEGHDAVVVRDLTTDIEDDYINVSMETDFPDEEPDLDPDNADITVERSDW